MGEYNGHHCWNCWNVALWIANDEPMYRFALECKNRPHIVRHTKVSSTIAANRFLAVYDGRTPDGAKYTHKAVKAALVGLE